MAKVNDKTKEGINERLSAVETIIHNMPNQLDNAGKDNGTKPGF